MLPQVKTPTQKLEKYKELIPKKQFEEIEKLARPLKNLKVNLVNATPRGGGVAEILKSLVPLMKGVGLKAEWYTIPPREDFFKITKEIHNALQGKGYDFPFSARKRYFHHMETAARLMQDMKADLWVFHDPQPAGVIYYLSGLRNIICRMHIDLTSPNLGVWKFVAGFLTIYDRVILSSEDFVKPEIKDKAVIFPPAIDPLAPKNQPLSLGTSQQMIKSFGIDPQKPLITQISRFDPWKDPLGVVRAYQLAKKEIPDLQLAMVGLFLAQDDPEAMRVFRRVKQKTAKDPNVFLFSNPNYLGGLRVDTFVNAMQVASDVILQKSIREGFGMTIAEAMWKRKAVIGGRVGGIKLQIENGENGFLVSNPKETAEKIVALIENPGLKKRMGQRAYQTVKRKFLMPRLLRDYLKLFKQLIFSSSKKPNPNEGVRGIFLSY